MHVHCGGDPFAAQAHLQYKVPNIDLILQYIHMHIHTYLPKVYSTAVNARAEMAHDVKSYKCVPIIYK